MDNHAENKLELKCRNKTLLS